LRCGGWQFWGEHTERRGTIPIERGMALWEKEGLAKTRVSDWVSGRRITHSKKFKTHSTNRL